VKPEQLQQAWQSGRIVPLAAPAQQVALAEALGPAGPAAALEPLQHWGPGVLVGSGGSSGRRRWCLQPLSHLQASAAATGSWLAAQGIEPGDCVHLNPLPLHHVSGLLPLVRSWQWGCAVEPLAPDLLRHPEALAPALALPADRPVLLSLVPTQLQRLLAVASAVEWLRQVAVIWVGGAPLPIALAEWARRAGLRLAPCYGATETAAMVCALEPDRFLAGASGCGRPLADVELQIDAASGAIAVRAARLSPGWLAAGQWQPLPRNGAGWWCSGDGGELGPAGLLVRGRLDGAIHSGGETVFPEELEERLQAAAAQAGLPLQALLLLPVTDPEWGQRLVALVRPLAGADPEVLVAQLAACCQTWPAAERPKRWLPCAQLAPTADGKWQRQRWQQWMASLETGPMG
jgi:O-succinylbenzoic acid--CoA ligase